MKPKHRIRWYTSYHEYEVSTDDDNTLGILVAALMSVNILGFDVEELEDGDYVKRCRVDSGHETFLPNIVCPLSRRDGVLPCRHLAG